MSLFQDKETGEYGTCTDSFDEAKSYIEDQLFIAIRRSGNLAELSSKGPLDSELAWCLSVSELSP